MELCTMLHERMANPFIILVGAICCEYAKYIELLNEYVKLHQTKHSTEIQKQYDLFHKHLEVHRSYTNYCNSVYEFKAALTDDALLEVDYLEVIGFHLPNTYSTVYIQATFDGEEDVNINLSFNNGWVMGVGGLPYGTVIFTRKQNYILEGRELVPFKC